MPDRSSSRPPDSSLRYSQLTLRSGGRRFALALVLCCAALLASGCGLPARLVKSKVTVPSLLEVRGTAETSELLAQINRIAQVRSIRGKVDLQFLDTSFAKCGVAEKYRAADGDIIVQRPGQVYVSVNGPFQVKIAEMTSDGKRFRVAVLQGDERYKRFVMGTNDAAYSRLKTEAANLDDCGGGDEKQRRTQERTVSALSSLRPQHFTDALLVRPVGTAANAGGDAQPDAGATAVMTYARSEFFNEEPDDRRGARRNSRVVRPYYLLEELAAGEGGTARLARRFWFDRSEGVRLARVQTFDADGSLVTDVTYADQQLLGESRRVSLPARIELTRPQDRYAIRITYQSPADVVLDKGYDAEAFVLRNQWQLPEVDLDKE